SSDPRLAPVSGTWTPGAQPPPAPGLTPATEAPAVFSPPSSAGAPVAGPRSRGKLAAIAVAAVLAAGAGVWYQFFRELPLDSLAVLPFVNVGGDPGTEYLSDGITESIINNLSQIPQLTVRSFSSVLRFKNKSLAPEEAGGQLKVRALLTGRLVRRGSD